jgi:sodium-dependent dicarboxylate transporter 2/3/5
MTDLSVDTESPRWRKTTGFWIGISLFVLIVLGPTPEGMALQAKYMAAVIVLMGFWWIGESMPLGITALIPAVAFPLLKIMPFGSVTPHYANHYVFLLLGGFFIALTMQRWNLHTRIALWIIRLVGTSAPRLVLGFMIASAFLSMWISNSATCMMMMPIGLGLVIKTEELQGKKPGPAVANFGACMMLGIAYASNIGGVGTLIGTFPNLVLAGIFENQFPDAPPITFVEWMKIGLPFTLVFIPLMWTYMVRLALPIKGRVMQNADAILKQEAEKLGTMKRGETMILAVFFITALLWIFRSDINLGAFTLRGWASLLGLDAYVHDSTVAMAMGILCFLLPVDRKRNVNLLDWKHAKQVPWDILLLFGGGFAVAAGFKDSGLTAWVGMQLAALQAVPLPVLIGAIVCTMTFLTEVTSNTASTQMLLPILVATAAALNVHPLLLMLPATIAASCAFMLPIGTPPNAIVFSSGRISLGRMAATGFFLNLIVILFITAFVFFWVVPIWGIALN